MGNHFFRRCEELKSSRCSQTDQYKPSTSCTYFVSAHPRAILLMCSYVSHSQTVSNLSAKVNQQHQVLQCNTVKHGAKIDQTASKIDAMNARIEETNDTTHDKIDRLSTKVEQVQTSVSSVRSVAKQAFDFLVSFSREAQETMRATIQSDWQIHRVLLDVQDRIAQTPTGLLNSNIKFENALGEYWEFPYEVFRHWEVSRAWYYPLFF